MNLVLLHPEDFISRDVARLTGRRREHVLSVHRVADGDVLRVGIAGGKTGSGEVISIAPEGIELRVALIEDPPAPLPVTLVLALPRPKVLNRVVASATSLGVKRLYLINAWRVEKSYWSSPRLSPGNLHMQSVLGLEQAGDTILPQIELRRLFRPFVEQELGEVAGESLRLLAHPSATRVCPHSVTQPVTLAIGPEGGWIDEELASLENAGFTPVSFGPRVLRVETAVAALLARLF